MIFFNSNKKNKAISLRRVVSKKKIKTNNNINKNNNNELCNESFIAKQLEIVGLNSYVLSTLTGNNTKISLHQCIQRTILFITWNYSTSYSVPIDTQFGIDIIKVFYNIIKKNYDILPDFVNYLKERRGLSVSTQLNYLYDITKSVKWFSMFRKNNSHKFRIGSLALTRWIECIKNIRKPLSRTLSLERSKENSMEKRVQDGSFPEGGLKQLKDCIKTDMPFIKSFKTNTITIDKSVYIRFMRILYSSIYSCGVQGRLAGKNNNNNYNNNNNNNNSCFRLASSTNTRLTTTRICCF